MNSKVKGTIIGLTSAVLLTGAGLLTYIGVNNGDKIASVFNGAKVYTEREYRNNFNKGYEEGIEHKDIYELKIEELLDKIEELSILKEALISSNETLGADNLNLQNKIILLEEQINNNLAEIEVLTKKLLGTFIVTFRHFENGTHTDYVITDILYGSRLGEFNIPELPISNYFWTLNGIDYTVSELSSFKVFEDLLIVSTSGGGVILD